MGILKELVDSMADISKNVFVSDRPNATTEQMKDFVIVALTGAMIDRNAYGDSNIRIDVFAKDRKGGLEATDKLEEMQLKVFEKFPMVNDKFTTYKPRLIAGGDDGLGFHYLMITAKIVFI
jgi:hypothetical protein